MGMMQVTYYLISKLWSQILLDSKQNKLDENALLVVESSAQFNNTSYHK